MSVSSESPNVLPKLVASASTGNANTWLHPRPIESKILRWDPAISV